MVTAVQQFPRPRAAAQLVVPGPPVAFKRPRFRRDGRSFIHPDVAEFRTRVHAAWLDAGRPTVAGPVRVDADFRIPVPASYRRRNGQPATSCPPFPRQSDLDNLAKALLDALADLVFDDDRDVVELSAQKRWTLGGGETIVTVREALIEEV